MAKEPDATERVSLDPLDPETALRALLQVEPDPKPPRRKRGKAKGPAERGEPNKN